MIDDRSKSQQEIDTRIDQLDEAFRKAEGTGEIHALESEWGQYFEGFWDVSPESEKLGPPIPKCWSGVRRKKRNDPKGKEEKEQIP